MRKLALAVALVVASLSLGDASSERAKRPHRSSPKANRHNDR